MNTDLFEVFIRFCSVKCAKKACRIAGSKSKICHAGHSLTRCDRHDTGKNRDFYSCNLTTLTEIVKVSVVKKQLCADIISPRINLGFQVLYFCQSVRCLRMALRKTRYANPHMWKMFLDKCDKLSCVFETVRVMYL